MTTTTPTAIVTQESSEKLTIIQHCYYELRLINDKCRRLNEQRKQAAQFDITRNTSEMPVYIAG